PGLWKINAEAMASSVYIQKLQELCPTPGCLILADNNEVGFPKFKLFMNPKTGKWKTAAELDAISLRMLAKVNELGFASDPLLFVPTFYGNREEMYRAFYAAFVAAVANWTGVEIIATAYSATPEYVRPDVVEQIGFAPEALCYEFAGPSMYPGSYLSTDLLDPDHEAKIASNVPA